MSQRPSPPGPVGTPPSDNWPDLTRLPQRSGRRRKRLRKIGLVVMIGVALVGLELLLLWLWNLSASL